MFGHSVLGSDSGASGDMQICEASHAVSLKIWAAQWPWWKHYIVYTGSGHFMNRMRTLPMLVPSVWVLGATVISICYYSTFSELGSATDTLSSFRIVKQNFFFLPNDLLFLIFRKTNQISSKLQGIPVNCQNNNKEITVSPIRFPSLFPQLCPFFSAHCMNVIPLFSLSLYIYFLILLLLSSYLVSTVLAVYMIL